MKRNAHYLLTTLLLGFFAWNATAQTTFSWRNDQNPTSGQWNVANYWWNGSATLPGGAEILFLDGSVGTTMTNDLPSTNRFKIIFGSTATPAARTVNGSTANTFYEYGSTWPLIENDAVNITHTLNFPINASTNSGYNLELKAYAGPLVLGTSAILNNNGRTIMIYGNNTAIDATNRYVKLSGVVSGAGGLNVSQNGTVKLNATNTYTGTTTVDNGELWIETVGDAIDASSAIWVGNGGQLTNVTKLFLSNTSGGTTFTRNINMNAGNASTRYLGGLNTSGTNTFTGTVTGTSSDLNLEQVSSGGITNFSGVISGSGGVVKVGVGTIQLSAANSYTGATTVTTGELRLTPSANSSNATQIVLNGGTLSTTGITASRTITASTLQLNNSSTIALGTNAHTMTFAASNGLTWVAAKTITITGWTGIAGASGTAGKIFVGNSNTGLTAGQLAQISFSGYSNTATILSTGEIVPTPTTKTVGTTGADFATLKLAFDAINANTSGLYSGTVILKVIDNTTEGTAMTLNPNGSIKSITKVAGGTGYTSAPTVTISAPPAGGIQATATVAVSAGAITTFTITNAGKGYTSVPTVSFGGPGTGATANAVVSGNYNRIYIYPTGTRLIASTVASPITLSGATNVCIDGRLNGTGASSLSITGTDLISAVIAFSNNAQSDTIKYCTLKGNATSSKGIVQFGSTATVTNGNGLNVIDHNLFTNNGTRPLYSVYSNGNTSFPTIGNTISNNEFKDCLSPTVANANVIYLAGSATTDANSGWTITGNSIYETTNLSTTTVSSINPISIGSSTSTIGGSGYTISNNYIGGTAAYCGGSAFVKDYSVTGNNAFNGINVYFTPGGAVSNIQGNKINNISWTNLTNAGWTGITIGGGDANVGTSVGNRIGSTTGNDSIIVLNSGATATSTVNGINISSTGTVDCQNNKIGAIKASGSASFGTHIQGIQKTAGAGTTTISNNVIGSTTTANSMNNISGVVQNIYGILTQGTGTITISGNTFANMTNATTTGNVYAIYQNGASTLLATKNLIHSLEVTSLSSGANVAGIYCNAGTNTVSNNIVTLKGNNPTNLSGLVETSGSVNTSFYHNTISLDGAPTSLALQSKCIATTGVANIRNIKNNILANIRSNGGTATGPHYAISMALNTTGTLSIDGNDYIASGTGGILCAYNGARTDLAAIRTATGQDAASVSINPQFTGAASNLALGFFPRSSALNGVDLTATVPTDFGGSSFTTSSNMGAYQWNINVNEIAPSAKATARIARTTSGVSATFDGAAVVELYTVNGKLIERTNAVGSYTRSLNNGLYIIRINGKATKFVK
jgi:autotransporter-associated beta strand protein